MPRPRKNYKDLKPRKHKGSAVMDVWDGTSRRTITLGKWESPEADDEFERIRTLLKAGKSPVAPARSDEPPDITVAEALLRYDDHCAGYYKHPDGTPTGTAADIGITIGYIRRACASLPLAEFGLKHFKLIRSAMIADGRVRNQVNRRTAMVISFVRWCAAEDLPVRDGLLQKLAAVRSLSPGREGVAEGSKREPADAAAVAAVIPLLSPAPRAIVQLIHLTGARPSEIANVRRREINTTSEPWTITPEQHKGTWRGRSRIIYLGPTARAILESWLVGIGPDDRVFTPKRSEDIRNAERSANRVTPKYPSHMKRNATKRKGREFADKFHRDALLWAIRRACKKAGVATFSPYQLRHLRAAELREQYGLEHVRAVLGHSFAAMSDHYSKSADKVLASRVANEIG